MPEKQVNIKVATDVDDSKVDALEKKVNQLRREKLQWEINVATQKLDETKAKIESLKQEKATLEVGVDDSRIDEINAEIAQLEGNAIDLQLSIDTSELRKAEAEIEEIDGKTIDIDANMSMQNISQGISQAKQGISELKQNMDEVAQAGMQSEQNKAFLEMNLGAEKARDTYQQISDIVASMPGDDNTMRSVLSTAQALGNNLNPDEMRAATATMADYMSGSATMGKQALESQQDIMKYLLDGNTAELERGSIVSSQVDKLKEATTFQERQKAMQEVLNELGYGGIAQQDTMLNKQAEWEGMIYNSQDALSSMWLGAEKGAMDYILQLNDASKGLLGMGIVAGQMVTGPFVEIMSGIGQIGVGFKSLKEAADFTGITGKLSTLKNTLMDVGSVAKTAALELLSAGKNALLAGANAVKSAAMWAIENGMKVLSTGASYALAAAQTILNAVMSMNPIMLVVIAIAALVAALIWAYYNVDWFRQMVDNAWASLVQFGQQIYGAITGALQWLGDLFNQFTSQLGLSTDNWAQAVLGFILFMATMPARLAVIFVNAIAKTLGFGDNFAQGLFSKAMSAVSGFANAVQGIPQALQNCLDWAYNMVMSHPIVQAIIWLGDRISEVFSRIGLGQGSPGKIYHALENELDWSEDLINKSSLSNSAATLGKNIVKEFGNPSLGVGVDTANASLTNLANGSVGNQTINLTLEIGSVDNEKRIQEIVEAVRRELRWNNKTSGRGV